MLRFDAHIPDALVFLTPEFGGGVGTRR